MILIMIIWMEEGCRPIDIVFFVTDTWRAEKLEDCGRRSGWIIRKNGSVVSYIGFSSRFVAILTLDSWNQKGERSGLACQ